MELLTKLTMLKIPIYSVTLQVLVMLQAVYMVAENSDILLTITQ